MTPFAVAFTPSVPPPSAVRPPLRQRPVRKYAHPLQTSSPVRCAATDDKKLARRSLADISITPFADTLISRTPIHSPLRRQTPTTLQINIGLTCNLACRHCHVESSPSRQETMSHLTAQRLLSLARASPTLQTADITGGAPELHAEFRFLVRELSAMGLSVIDRCNLAVLLMPEHHDLIPFLAAHGVRVVASMPCYSAENVERQRGNGVFDASIRALTMLNDVGYGVSGSGLELDLVYNPGGASLPPPQLKLETDYKRELVKAFGIHFSNLICITNMPIKRFADDLLIRGSLDEYMQLLLDSFNPDTVEGVMCRDMVHVAHDGSVYDCDFNYALDMHLPLNGVSNRDRLAPDVDLPKRLTVFDVDNLSELADRPIATGKHCYGCTAGSGSSCGGSLSD